jgi:hypothetical protein
MTKNIFGSITIKTNASKPIKDLSDPRVVAKLRDDIIKENRVEDAQRAKKRIV